MGGINIKLPLIYDSTEGPYKSNMNIIDAINQNIYVLLMTNKGERVMDHNFGIGINSFLFNQMSDELIESIKKEVYRQFSIYLPKLNIAKFLVKVSDESLNILEIYIRWEFPQLGLSADFFSEIG